MGAWSLVWLGFRDNCLWTETDAVTVERERSEVSRCVDMRREAPGSAGAWEWAVAGG